jgi:hypothetical protein
MKVLYFLMRVSSLIDTELTVGAPGRNGPLNALDLQFAARGI